MVLFLSTFFDVCTVFNKIIELTHSTIFYSQMNKQYWTTKQSNYEILPMYIYIIFIFWYQFALSHSLMFVRKINNHILQCSDIKCTYEIEPLQFFPHILKSSNCYLRIPKMRSVRSPEARTCTWSHACLRCLPWWGLHASFE